MREYKVYVTKMCMLTDQCAIRACSDVGHKIACFLGHIKKYFCQNFDIKPAELVYILNVFTQCLVLSLKVVL